MNIIRYPEKSEWAKIVERPHLDSVLADVKRRGDDAVKGYELKFDHVDLPDLAVSEAEMNEAEKLVSAELKAAIMVAHHNIQAFHEAQKFRGKKVETQPGVTCWQKSIAIEKVGLYIPGGTAPLFSTVLMLATPAKIAGCQFWSLPASLVSAKSLRLVVFRPSVQWPMAPLRSPRSIRSSVLATSM